MNDKDVKTAVAAFRWVNVNILRLMDMSSPEDIEISITILRAFLNGVIYAENHPQEPDHES